jgi:hypothetical protein
MAWSLMIAALLNEPGRLATLKASAIVETD